MTTTAIQTQPTVIESPINWRPNGIKNLTPGLVERGKIKIGMKGAPRQKNGGEGTWQAPVKIDHFIVTSMERGQDSNFVQDQKIMEMLGDAPREIPVQLVYDDINLNFPTRYAMYNGKSLQCTGDGEAARWRNQDGTFQMVQCPCPRQDPTYTARDKCKMTGTLSAIISGADVIGGVWKFRTTSFNSVVGILSSLAMIKRVSGGVLAGLPLVMKLSPKAVTDPVGGKQQTIYVVSLEYRGSTQSLRDHGYSALLEQQKHGVRIEQLEDHARKLLAYQPDPYEAEADEIVPEFYPQQQDGFQADVRTSHPQTSVVQASKTVRTFTKSLSSQQAVAEEVQAKQVTQTETQPEPEITPELVMKEVKSNDESGQSSDEGGFPSAFD